MVVQVRSSAIDKAWRSGGGESVWLVLDSPGRDVADAASYDRFQAAVTSANDSATARGDDDTVFAEAPSYTQRGFAVLMSRAADRAALRRFTADLAVALEGAGVSGSLSAATETFAPVWSQGGPVLTAFVAWAIDLDAMTRDPRRTSGWHVPAEPTGRIVDLLATWCGPLTPCSIVRAGQHGVALDAPGAAEVSALLARGVGSTGIAGLEIVDDDARAVRQAALAPGGETVLQVASEDDAATSWRDTVDSLRSALTALPADVNHGFIRPTVRRALSAQMLDASLALPGIQEYHVRYNKHLLDRYVPDVHGVQVLRDLHLDALGDTSGWQVTDLGSGRHLVEAEDLGPWFADVFPDPAALDVARAQFAPVLLTPEVIAAHPAPWLG